MSDQQMWVENKRSAFLWLFAYENTSSLIIARLSRMYSHRQSECSRIVAGNTGVAVGLIVDQPKQADYSGKIREMILSWQCERFCRR
jgi:hypothetical protein